MAIIDQIKYESPSDEFFVWKHDSETIKFGSQLIVGEGQAAIFVKGGEALDVFGPGTHTLETGNIPFIEKIINIPFGGDTPFTAEVWFVSTTVKRDMKWGTSKPIPLFDKSIGFPISLRAYGKWGVRIAEPRVFLIQFVGSQASANDKKIHDYLIGEVIQKLSDLLAEKIRDGVPVLEINAELNELSEQNKDNIGKEFLKYGIEVVNFNIENINIPKEELDKIQEVFAKTFEARELSKVELGKSYAAIKSFEVLGDAANNQSDGGVGAMLSAGIGLGAGLPLGQEMGQRMSVGGEDTPQSLGPSLKDKLKELKSLLDEGLITEDQYKEKQTKYLEDF
jgi:membrane protease subunit (stomatin/prohibitin family)